MSYVYLYFYEIFSRLAIIPQYLNFYKSGILPEHKKRNLIKTLVSELEFTNSIETGTYLGRSTKILSAYVRNVYTIEIKEDLYEFTKKKYNKLNIKFLLGDSEDLIAEIIQSISGKTIFYLDSHASGGVTGRGKKVTSLSGELRAISRYSSISESLIVIDDAKSINGKNDYPEFAVIKELVDQNNMRLYKTKTDSYVLSGSKLPDLPAKVMKYLNII